MNEKQEAAYRFQEIMDEIGLLVEEALGIVRENDPGDYSQAEVYWGRQIPAIMDSAGNGLLGGSMHEMVHSLSSLQSLAEEEDGEDEQD